MKLEFETITPSMAKRYLQSNTANRSLKTNTVQKYAEDMKSGNWTTCLEPIAFYKSGAVADGQHRLEAVVRSGRAQRFIVARGIEQKDGLNINTGVPRTLVDAAKISGAAESLSTRLIATARAIEDGEHGSSGRNRYRPNSERLAITEKHRKAAEWALEQMGTSRITNALTLAAIARAWYWEQDKARLGRSCYVLSQGSSEGRHEDAAVSIRTYLMEHGSTLYLGTTWRDTFLKVQNSIHYFMKGKSLHVIKGVGNEQYPLKTT